ncbi:MAG: hypothetical protein E6Q97_13160 [Desulfurellales bacterium]|nr:MAG: hypothetical protein E6Q97_13160 [Desulfurellales bacterium]
MAAYLNDRVFDNGLTVLDTEADKLYITSSQATTYTEAITTYALGVKNTPTVSAPADRSGGGREVTVSAITDGSVTGNGTAGFYAMVDSANTRLLAAGPLDTTQGVTSGNTFTLTSFKIGIPDPA